MSRQAVAAGLEYLRGIWRTLPTSDATLHAWADEAQGYDPDTIAAAFRLLVKTHRQAAPPVPALFGDALKDAYGRRFPKYNPRPVEDDGPVTYCDLCGTTTLRDHAEPPRDVSLWSAIKRKWWELCGLITGNTLQMPARMHPVCKPDCPRWSYRPQGRRYA